MKTSTRNERKLLGSQSGFVLIGVLVALSVLAGGHVLMMMHGTGATPPPASEFGLGPRASANGLYTVTLRPAQTLRPRKMQTIHVMVLDNAGHAIDGATLAIEGGMPQHGHGLPTQPRVTQNLGDGVYEIEGVRFNMGGWWVFTLAISTPAGADSVTFNLSL
jgi:YtkA-like